MTIRFKTWTVILLAVFMISACAPSPSAPTEAPIVPATPAPAESAGPAVTPVPTQVTEVQPAATPRGPNLEATDPTTISLASGGLQLVEFFRFT